MAGAFSLSLSLPNGHLSGAGRQPRLIAFPLPPLRSPLPLHILTAFWLCNRRRQPDEKEEGKRKEDDGKEGGGDEGAVDKVPASRRRSIFPLLLLGQILPSPFSLWSNSSTSFFWPLLHLLPSSFLPHLWPISSSSPPLPLFLPPFQPNPSFRLHLHPLPHPIFVPIFSRFTKSFAPNSIPQNGPSVPFAPPLLFLINPPSSPFPSIFFVCPTTLTTSRCSSSSGPRLGQTGCGPEEKNFSFLPSLLARFVAIFQDESRSLLPFPLPNSLSYQCARHHFWSQSPAPFCVLAYQSGPPPLFVAIWRNMEGGNPRGGWDGEGDGLERRAPMGRQTKKLALITFMDAGKGPDCWPTAKGGIIFTSSSTFWAANPGGGDGPHFEQTSQFFSQFFGWPKMGAHRRQTGGEGAPSPGRHRPPRFM